MAKRMANMALHSEGFGERQKNNKKKHGGEDGAKSSDKKQKEGKERRLSRKEEMGGGLGGKRKKLKSAVRSVPIVASTPSRNPMSPIAISDTVPAAAAVSSKASKPWAKVGVSELISNIRNRGLVGGAPSSGDQKPFLNLGLGDPSVFGNMPPPVEALDAINKALRSGKADGYPASVGYKDARDAVAEYFDEGVDGQWRVKGDDVVMCHGASGALEMAFSTLADSTKNVLLPKPLFTAYETILTQTGAEIRYYDLLPEQDWEVDLASVEKQVDENTAFLLINNPSNPCGSNWSEAHLREIAAFATRHQLVVISDEVYAGMAWDVSGPRPASADAPRVQGKFNRGVFTPFAAVATSCPVLVCGAVSKRWLAPGWRTGWVIVHDPLEVLGEVRQGLDRFAFRIQGPSSTIQMALPEMFANTPDAFFTETLDTLASTGKQLHARLSQIPGLKPLLPQGAMYLMCGGLTPESFGFPTDTAFAAALKQEENVLILPGECFRLEGFLRFVTTVPLPVLMQACDRLEEFCARHRVVKA
ncbi:hypothetical protein MNV49_003749 [Pseudohyphozyma bogoriensis]|nr:hypothetical protein MNV49_003749 [Pseudohyphozyma bogoriensis]